MSGVVALRVRPRRAGAGHAQAWAIARTQETFEVADLAALAGQTEQQILAHVRAWLRDGAVARERASSRGVPAVFRVDNPDRYDLSAGRAPGPETPHGNMWVAMRRMSSFTPVDVAAHAATEAVPLTVEDAQAYCRALAAAGYLRATRTSIPGKRQPVYRLVKNTGPVAPRPRRVTGLHDANTGEFFLHDGALP